MTDGLLAGRGLIDCDERKSNFDELLSKRLRAC